MTKKLGNTVIHKRTLDLKDAIENIKYTAFPGETEAGTLSPGMPVALIGEPGIGKTASLLALAEEMGYEGVEVIIGSQLTPEMISGIPSVGETKFLDADGSEVMIPTVTYLNEHFQVEILRKKKVILLLDEYSNSPAGVQAAMLRLLNERVFPDGSPVPPETAIVLATNSARSSVNPALIAPPTQNRIAWLPVSQNLKDWTEGMLEKWGQPMMKNERNIRKMVAKYLEGNPGAFQERNRDERQNNFDSKMDENSKDAALYAWRSPRSWDNLIMALARLPHDDAEFFRKHAKIQAESIIGVLGLNDFNDALESYIGTHIQGALETMSVQEMFDNPEEVARRAGDNDANLTSAVGARVQKYYMDVLEAYNANKTPETKGKMIEATAQVASLLFALADRGSPAYSPVFRPTLFPVCEKISKTLMNFPGGVFINPKASPRVPLTVLEKHNKRLHDAIKATAQVEVDDKGKPKPLVEIPVLTVFTKVEAIAYPEQYLQCDK